jgi:hypothetical protein
VKALVKSVPRLGLADDERDAGTSLLDLKRAFRGHAALLLAGEAAVSPEHCLSSDAITSSAGLSECLAEQHSRLRRRSERSY